MRSAEERVRAAEIALLEAWDMLPHAVQQEAADLLHRAKDALEAGSQDNAVEHAALAQAVGTPPLPIQVRGLYYSPREETTEQIVASLDRMAAHGINALFLRPSCAGPSIHKTGSASQSPPLTEWDRLQRWADECAVRRIELHLWLRLSDLEVLADPPPTSAMHQEDCDCSSAQHDPAGSRATQEASRILTRLSDLLTAWSVQGLHVDLTVQALAEGSSRSREETSFTDQPSGRLSHTAPGMTEREQSVEPENAPYHWVAPFLEGLHRWKKENRPHLLLSAAVECETDRTDPLKGMDGYWQSWIETGWIEMLALKITLEEYDRLPSIIGRLKTEHDAAWLLPRLEPQQSPLSAGQLAVAWSYFLAEELPGALFALPEEKELQVMELLGSPRMRIATPWSAQASLASFAAWVIEGMNRWVAEDLLPNETALDLDALAHEVAHWLARKSDKGRYNEWLTTLHAAHDDLDGPFYRSRGSWLRRQISLLIRVLDRRIGTAQE